MQKAKNIKNRLCSLGLSFRPRVISVKSHSTDIAILNISIALGDFIDSKPKRDLKRIKSQESNKSDQRVKLHESVNHLSFTGIKYA